jgi:hypothetical protein
MKIDIILDMDGTIADIYNQDGWLERLRTYRPVFDKLPETEFGELFGKRYNELKKNLEDNGVECSYSISTWLPPLVSAQPQSYIDGAFLKLCAIQKRKWVEAWTKKYGIEEPLKFHIKRYGESKQKGVGAGYCLLIDDNIEVRHQFESLRKKSCNPDWKEMIVGIKEIIKVYDKRY